MEPFLKWAGGKRWVISRYPELIPSENEFNNYVEPFLGGGAVFFHIKPSAGILSDVNNDLINCYRTIRDSADELQAQLAKYQSLHSAKFYYEMRDSKPRVPVTRAARFLYLNRTCWNGLYRVNQKGIFNVPIGTKQKVVLDHDDFELLSVLFEQMEILTADFETTIDRASSGDFVFVDPPYTVKHNLNGFVKYNEKIFSWDDQIRLRNAIERGVERGVLFLILNADHNSIRDLYEGMGTMHTLNRASVISGDANARGIYSELAIKCW